jgi:hypothetical protein
VRDAVGADGLAGVGGPGRTRRPLEAGLPHRPAPPRPAAGGAPEAARPSRRHRDAALGMGLSVHVQQRLPGDPDDAARDQDLAGVQVHVAPLQADQLVAAGAEDDGQAQDSPSSGSSATPWSAGERPPSVRWGCTGPADRWCGREYGWVWPAQPHTPACLKAPDSTVWTSWTAEADSGQPRAQSGSWTCSAAPGRGR